MTTDANTGSGTSNGTVFLMDTTMPNGTDNTDVSQYVSYSYWAKMWLTRDWLQKKYTNILLHSTFNTKNYAKSYTNIKTTHFENSKMVKWVNIIQKLRKIQGKM